MDPITQTALGAVAGAAAGGHKAPRAALLAGGLAGFLPDLDVLFQVPGDPLSGLIYHRHFTHALLMIPVIAALAWAPLAIVPRWRHLRKPLWWAALAGAATHGLLDTFTSYGTLLLWPFSVARLAWDWMPIVDPVYTLLLLIGIGWSLYSRKPHGAWFGLAASFFFFTTGIVQHHRVASAQELLAASRGHEIERGRVMPMPLSSVLWRSVYEHDGRLYVDGFRAGPLSEVMWQKGGVRDALLVDDLPADLASDEDAVRAFHVFEWFADGYIARVPGDNFQIGDYRYVVDLDALTPLWGIELDTIHQRSVRRVDYPIADGRASALLTHLFHGGKDYKSLP